MKPRHESTHAEAGTLSEALKIDSQDQTPLYLQVRKALLGAIRRGFFQADDALPSERTLSEMIGISRVTARKAIDALAAEGVIVRKHGSGNYISPLLEQPLSRLTSFTEELKQRGFTPTSRWLTRVVARATPEELLTFGLSPGAKVVRLERVRMANDVPMAFESSVLPMAFVPKPDALQDSLYAYLAKQGCLPARALQHIRASNASQRHAQLLSIAEGLALMDVTRISYLEDGRVVEVTQTLCRNDYYDFVVELRR
ncbi:MAG TPA: GntR family transcriptional regulator [Holophaga sp.]|nr:GntR family transcriptional regulator [Holophaga sp.]